MLILQRKQGQSFMIGQDITITVQEIGAGRVRLSIDAPRNVSVLREELVAARGENAAAAREEVSPLQLLQLLKQDNSSKQER